MDKKSLAQVGKYQTLVDGSFRSRFPEWDKLSETDPVRLFADALSLSLSSIEQRQNRLVDALLDCVPSLVGFEPLPARLPTGVFGFTAPAKLREAVAFNAGDTFRFRHGEEVVFGRLLEDFTLVPPTPENPGPAMAVLELFSSQPECSLGALEGVPWESLAFPAGLARLPEVLNVRFPNESRVALQRASSELLRLRHTDPREFQSCFFYNPARHEVILPAADGLMGDFQGGVQVELPQAEMRPSQDWYATLAFINEQPKSVAAIAPVAPLTGFVPRETPEGFLKRFYGLVRRLPGRAAGFFPADLCLQIPSVEPRVRLAEFESRAGGTAFFLYFGGPAAALTPAQEQEAVARVEGFLHAIVPLGDSFSVPPFNAIPLRVVAPVSPAHAQNSTGDTAVEPFPFGLCRRGEALSKARLMEQLFPATETSATDLIVGASGQVAHELVRQPGQRYVLEVEGVQAEVGHV